MKYGNWVPISKAFTKHLPKDRSYTEIEAAFSLAVDYDNENGVTIAGYSDLWQWSRSRVRNFLNRLGVTIIYPQDTRKKQNQKGQIAIQIKDRYGTETGQIRFIDSKDLSTQKDRNRTDKGQIKDRYRSTTRDPNPKPNPKEYKYNKKVTIPSDFKLTDGMKMYARKNGFDIDLVAFTDSFILKCQAHGYKYKDWVAAWKNWLREEKNNADNRCGKTKSFGKSGPARPGSTKYAGIGTVLSESE